MTTKQRIHLMAELWPDAAAALGCSADDRERRLEEISKALRRPVDSASDIKTNKDFDDVKGHLLALSQSANVNAQVKIVNMPRTRLLTGIRQQYSDALVLHFLATRFVWPVWLRRTYPDLTGMTISRTSRRPAPKWVVAEFRASGEGFTPALEDLSDQELEQLRDTLARQPKVASRHGQSKEPATAVGVADGDPDWNVG